MHTYSSIVIFLLGRTLEMPEPVGAVFYLSLELVGTVRLPAQLPIEYFRYRNYINLIVIVL
jgi:hypothetical protein